MTMQELFEWQEKYGKSAETLLLEHEMGNNSEGGCTARFRTLTAFERFLVEKLHAYNQFQQLKIQS